MSEYPTFEEYLKQEEKRREEQEEHRDNIQVEDLAIITQHAKDYTCVVMLQKTTRPGVKPRYRIALVKKDTGEAIRYISLNWHEVVRLQMKLEDIVKGNL